MDARTFVRNHDGSKTGCTEDVQETGPTIPLGSHPGFLCASRRLAWPGPGAAARFPRFRLYASSGSAQRRRRRWRRGDRAHLKEEGAWRSGVRRGRLQDLRQEMHRCRAPRRSVEKHQAPSKANRAARPWLRAILKNIPVEKAKGNSVPVRAGPAVSSSGSLWPGSARPDLRSTGRRGGC